MKRLLIMVAVIAIAAVGYVGYRRYVTPAAPPPAPAPVAQAPNTVVSTEARVAPVKQSRLAFNQPGRVQEVLVQEGDRVAAGQVVARLEAASLRDAVTQAEAAVQIAKAQLDRVQAPPRDEDIAVAEMALRVAQAQLARAQAGPRPEEIAAAQAQVNAAQADLARAKAGAVAEDVESARLAIEQAKNTLWAAQAQRDAVCGRTADAPKLMEKLGIPQADCDAARARVQSSEQGVQLAEQAYQKVQSGPRGEDVNPVAARVSVAQAQLQAARAGARPVDVAVAQAQVDQAQAQLDAARAGARLAEVAVAQAEVQRAEAALQAAKTALADTELKAPYGGVVAQILLRPGEAANPATPALLIGDTTQLRLETEDLAETDIAKIAPGQTASVSLDALPEETFTAKVTRVSPISAERRGDTVYTVWLDFTGGSPQGALWGMKALVDIQTK